MDKQKAAADIIACALPDIPFDGWTQAGLKKAALAAGYKRTDVIRVFPGGTVEAAETFMRNFDTRLADALQGYYLDQLKIRERITTAVRVKLELMTPHREAIRKTMALLGLPFYVHRSLKLLYETVDNIWYLIGDTSTDFNFYTKRLTLAGVWSTTLVFWLDDKSAGHTGTWDFLDRRIADVMAFEKARQQLRKKLF